ncbi:hypothetical protein BCR34DRAFT_44113 [Clohesyomyces aquaticus]|uniref:Pentatricopeptide repeat protein n=1 Tax=Clohesyomyces aquaticus TaxID=1231657 RepID=A0A1Y1Z5K1_9PLEO|nr:hypothetical protein BCR34DRAFT_44113 [Clohesyomyces aquaticus]
MSLLHSFARTTPPVSHIARPILSFLCPRLSPTSARRTFSQTATNRPPRVAQSRAEPMDNFFIQALVRVASCEKHARQMTTLRDMVPSLSTHHKTRRKSTFNDVRRHFHPTPQPRHPLKGLRRFAESELKALVDYYGIELEPETADDALVEDGPLIWNVGDEHQPFPVKEEVHKTYVEKLEGLLRDEESPHEEIYSTYKLLPSPGVAYLRVETIRSLLHHLSVVERASQISMQRFLSILDDMKDAHIHIIRAEWTSAIYFAGRFLGRVTSDEAHSALLIWQDMEKRAGVRGGTVTMNVLFDIAVKAGKYTLAEAFLREMKSRQLKIHRHFRVSLLYYHGVLQNGNAVRKAYQDLVEAGEIVDTVVMNAVIAALFRAGEPAAAEHVFERMKRLHATKRNPRPPPRTWRESRKLGLELTYSPKRRKPTSTYTPITEIETASEEAQDSAPIAPDTRTYGLLIRFHASVAGNIDRVTELLDEMRLNSIPLDGTIYIVILYGFSSFGGVRYTSWTRDRLESIWRQYLKAASAGQNRTWISSMAAVVALKAFRKCTDGERTERAWREVRESWNPRPSEEEVETYSSGKGRVF